LLQTDTIEIRPISEQDIDFIANLSGKVEQRQRTGLSYSSFQR
jgi:hypothetical protein